MASGEGLITLKILAPWWAEAQGPGGGWHASIGHLEVLDELLDRVPVMLAQQVADLPERH